MQLSPSRQAILGVLGALLAFPACLDMDPVQGNAPAYGDTLLSEATPTPGLCQSCIWSGICTDELDACNADTKCAKVLECVNLHSCFELHTQEDIYKCSVPCAYGAGITSSTDIAVTLSLNVTACGERL